jgi:translation elongation factor EF-1alpha
MEIPSQITISLLGHKDHGKSTLIGRLLQDTGSISQDRIDEARGICKSLGKEFELAFLLDSFVEEREGGFTLDTTTAQMRYKDRIYNLVDVPGHKELVRNMLSGASLADAAVLIVSAKKGEGLKSETRLHIYLARFLGLKKLIVAINKMDTAGYEEKEFERIAGEMTDVLAGFGFGKKELAFVPISAKLGDNVMTRSGSMPWYAGKTLIAHIEELQGDASSALVSLPARMVVQDVYVLDGDSIAVGRVESGRFSPGERVWIGPSGRETSVRELRTGEGRAGNEALAGRNAAMMLEKGEGIARGSVICGISKPAKALTGFSARVFCFPNASMESGDRITITIACQESQGVISRIERTFNPITDERPKKTEAGRVAALEAADVSIENSRPLVLDRFSDVQPMGRFVMSKGGSVIGVGLVL